MKIIIVAPFWQNPKYVGNIRLKRFIRWLDTNKHEITLLIEGKNQYEQQIDGLRILSINNTLSILLDSLKKINIKFLKWILFIPLNNLFKIFAIPDENIFWAKSVYKSDFIKRSIDGVDLIIASSPLESSLVLGYSLSELNKCNFIADMRDGWLDESLNKYRTIFRWRLKKEKILEKKVLNRANTIFVTSNNWRKLLIERIPELNKKLVVLTNSIPIKTSKINNLQNLENENSIVLIYAGRFSGSSYRRNSNLVFSPIYNYLKNSKINIRIDLIGEFHTRDIHTVQLWNKKFKSVGSEIKITNYLQKEDLYDRFNKANGLIMLSVSKAAIPSKFFDYLNQNKPILVFGETDSSVYEVCQKVPSAFFVDNRLSNDKESQETIGEFTKESNKFSHSYEIPEEFEEDYLKNLFFNSLSSYKIN